MAGYKSRAFIQFFVKRKKDQKSQTIGGVYKIMANQTTIQKQTLSSLKNPQIQTMLPTNLIQSFEQANQKHSKEINLLKDKKNTLTLGGEGVAEKLATDELEPYKTTNTQTIQDKYSKKQENLDQKSIQSQNSFNEKLSALNEKYENNQKNLNETALNSGWKHSTIYQKQMKQLENDFNTSKNDLTSSYSQNQAEIEFQKTLLETEKQNALKNFDISYAQKLSKKIEELTSSASKQNKSEISKVDTRLSQLQDMVNQEKALSVINYLNTYSKAEAKAFLNLHQNTLLSELGSQVFKIVKANYA